MPEVPGHDRVGVQLRPHLVPEPSKVVEKANVAADVLADATTVPYVAANEVKADARLYTIDGGEWATKAREVEAAKVAERERAKEEFMQAYLAMIAEQEAEEATQATAGATE